MRIFEEECLFILNKIILDNLDSFISYEWLNYFYNYNFTMGQSF